jgi:hypothetical protein
MHVSAALAEASLRLPISISDLLNNNNYADRASSREKRETVQLDFSSGKALRCEDTKEAGVLR